MIKIVQPDNTQSKDVRRIWRESFHDTEAYLDFFFSRRYRTQQTLLAQYNGESAGMIMLLPATIKKSGYKKKALMIFAGSVLPQFRGKGIFYRLIDQCQDQAQAESAALFVMPRSDSWQSYYIQRNFDECFISKMFTFQVPSANVFPLWRFETLKAEDYYPIREVFFKQSSFISWDAEACAFAIDEICFCGGFSLYASQSEEKYAIIGEVQNSCLSIKETNLPEDLLISALSALAQQKSCDRVRVNLPEFSTYGEPVKAGMGTGMREYSSCWLNFVLN